MSKFEDIVSIHLNRNYENDLVTKSQNRSRFTSQAGLTQFSPDKTDAMANEDAKDLHDKEKNRYSILKKETVHYNKNSGVFL